MHNTERSFAARRTFADEHVEYWGKVYLANPHVARRGVLFETFLLAPQVILAALGRPVVDVSRPGLLPRQREAQGRIDRDAALIDIGERAIAELHAESRCSNGAWVVKTRHHAWPPRRWGNHKLVEM